MNKVDLSIIVPVYNVESYLKKCIDSILKIKKINYEIILVNDGSTDDSESICMEYKNKYSSIIEYVYQENKGLSGARNTGIKKSCGKYIYFIDSDDFIDSEAFENAYFKFKKSNADIVFFGYYYEGNDYKIPMYNNTLNTNQVYSASFYMKHELKNRNLQASVWCGIYARELIIKNQCYFTEGLLHEDERWNPLVLLNAEKILITDEYVYHYIQRDNSIMHKKDKTKNGMHLIETCKYLEKKFNEIDDKELIKLMNNKIAMLYMKGTEVGKLYRKEYKFLIDRKYPLKHSYTFYDRFKSLIFLVSPKIYSFISEKKGQ